MYAHCLDDRTLKIKVVWQFYSCEFISATQLVNDNEGQKENLGVFLFFCAFYGLSYRSIFTIFGITFECSTFVRSILVP